MAAMMMGLVSGELGGRQGTHLVGMVWSYLAGSLPSRETGPEL